MPVSVMWQGIEREGMNKVNYQLSCMHGWHRWCKMGFVF